MVGGYGIPVGPDAASILRRYEFHEFSGDYKAEDHEATFAEGLGDSHPGRGDAGMYLGSQNGAVNMFAAVPEPETYAMLLAGLGLVAGIFRRRRNRST